MTRVLHRLAERILGRLLIGWLQLIHNRARLLAAVGGVTFANVLIFMQLGFMGALFESSVQGHHEFDADIVLTSADYLSLREANPIPRSRIGRLLGHPSVESATAVHQATVIWDDGRTGANINFRLNGVDPDARVFVKPEVQALLRLLTEPDTVIVDRRTRELGLWLIDAVDAGERPEIEIAGRRVCVVGLFEQGASFDVDGGLIASTATFSRLVPGRAEATPTLLLGCLASDTIETAGLRPRAAVSAAAADAVVEQLRASQPEADVAVYTKQGFIDVERSYQVKQSPIGIVFGFGVVMGLIVGMIIIYQVLSTDVQDHLAEYATFKAMGYGPRFFLSIVFEEAVCLAGMGFLPALLIASALYSLAASATALPISMPWDRPILVFCLTVVAAVISGAVATRRLGSADPAELF
ncbi:MAG: ABC transporter permease DevC [Planctomycetota bacterium]